MATEILIATHNPGKVNELRQFLNDSQYDLICLADITDVAEIEETGLTFNENASLKAIGYARQTDHMALADDSGLEVEALGGRPGVLSARYGGPDTSFAEKMAILLAEMDETGASTRRARLCLLDRCCESRGPYPIHFGGRLYRKDRRRPAWFRWVWL